MYKRNVPLIIIISILILMLALVSWQLLKINNTLTSLQQQIAKAALVSNSTASSDYEIGRARVGKECRSRWSPYH